MAIPYSGLNCLLHDHLDGAFPIGVILPWLFERNGKLFHPSIDLRKQVREKFLDPHANIVEAFSNTTGLLQSRETIHEAAKNHVIIRARQGIRYDEFMLAPQYHLLGEFAEEAETDRVSAMARVIEAVVDGIKDAERLFPQIEANLIVAIGRELAPVRAIEVLKALELSDRNYVVGWNLVCDEAAFPPELHQETFDYADERGIYTEIHGSEWVRSPEDSPDFERDLPKLKTNLRTILKMFAKSKYPTLKRVGHGIALPYDRLAMTMCQTYNIGVTGCPGSNLQGRNIPDLKSLEIRELLDLRILWSMNPDDDFFQPDINEVYQMCNDVYRFSSKEKLRMLKNAWLTRFGNRKPIPNDIILSLA